MAIEIREVSRNELVGLGIEPDGSPYFGNYLLVEHPGAAYVGYLEHDDDCENPLTSCDGMGHIHHHPGSRYGEKGGGSKYCEALGLDRDGSLDLDLVEDAYLGQIKDTLTAADFSAVYAVMPDAPPAEELRELALREVDNSLDVDSDLDYAAHCIAWELYGGPTYPAAVREAVDALFEGKTIKDAETLWKEARHRGDFGDKDAVLLDLYDHSGLAYSTAGSGMQCNFDTSHGVAVWVPDDCARAEIERRGAVYAFGRITEGWPAGKTFTAAFHHEFRNDSETFDTWIAAFQWLHAIAESEGWQASPEQQHDGRRVAAVELAGQACDEYTAWVNGDCYGYVIEHHSRISEDAFEFVGDEESVWGHVGSDYAEEALSDALTPYANREPELWNPPPEPEPAKQRVFVYVSGGVVQSILADNADLDVTVIDRDDINTSNPDTYFQEIGFENQQDHDTQSGDLFPVY